HKPQVAPPVPPRSQMRWPGTPVWMQSDGDLRDAQRLQGCLDHHLRGELHAGRFELQLPACVFGKPAKPAMEIARRALEQEPPDERKTRIADPAVLPWH